LALLVASGLVATSAALASEAHSPQGPPGTGPRYAREPASLSRGLPGRATFAGGTSDESPFVLTLSPDGRRVSLLVIHWDAKCTSGETFPFGDVLVATRRAPPTSGPVRGNPYFGKPIGRTGSFKGTSLSTIEFETATANVTQEIRGKLGKSKGTGTWKAHVDVRDKQSGQSTDACDTGTLRWTAPKPQTAFYGGVTTQLEPVVVQLSRNRRSVRLVRIGWAAACVPAGGFAIGDALEKFPLKRGRFGDRFSQSFPIEGGGQRTLDYELTGTVRRKRARGTFKARYKEVDANGTTTGDCVSPKISWRARQ
jgi:hypothetical protein